MNKLKNSPTAVLAKIAATVDIVSGGRLDFGTGAGGSRATDPHVPAGVHREYDSYGIDVGLTRRSPRRPRRGLHHRQTDVDRGRTVRLRRALLPAAAAICEPKPLQQPGPPILIGAGGERTALRIVAEHADIWNCPLRGNVEEFRHKSSVLDEHCRAIGRDPNEITRSVQVLVSSEEPSARLAQPPVNGPSAVRDLLAELIDAGAAHLVIAPIPPIPPVRWLADEIVHPVLAQLRTA